MNKLYTRFLEVTSSDTHKEVINKKFLKIFKNIEFSFEEDKFNEEFLQCLFNRKKI